MNQQQAQTVIGQAQQIDSFDFEAVIKRVYPDRTTQKMADAKFACREDELEGV